MRIDSSIYIAVFFSALASLGYEVLLVRVFSIALWYHFAFMVVSIAMLGLAVSGTVLAVFRARHPGSLEFSPAWLNGLSAAMILGYVLAVRIPFDPVRLSWDKTQILLITLYYLILAIPFFVSGMIIASLFSSKGSNAGILYAADLTGAALGSIIVIALQTLWSPGRCVFFFALLPLCGTILIGKARVRLLSAAMTGSIALIFVLNPFWINIPLSPYKELPTMLQLTGSSHIKTFYGPQARVDIFKSPGVRYAPGLSLAYRGELPGQIGISVDGGGVMAVTSAKSDPSTEFVRYLPAALAYDLRPGADVMLINPGGGLPVLMAETYGAASVDPIETNPVLVRAVRGITASAEPIYNSNTRIALARTILPPPYKRYDIVDLSLTGSIASGHYGAGEDYSLTVEAFERYLQSLKSDGILSLSLYIVPPYRAELRIPATLLAALRASGVEQPADNLAAVRSLEAISILAKRSPFSATEIDRLRMFTDSRWFDPVYYTGMDPDETNRNIQSSQQDLAIAFGMLLDRRSGKQFIDNYAFDISPATDERPFFHDHLRVSRIGEIYELVQHKLDFFIREGYLLPAICLQLILLGASLIILPAIFSRERSGNGKTRFLLYFGLLGVGYMCVEIPLIQKAVLYLEHPVYAISVVLASLLVSSGMGSIASHRLGARHLWKITMGAGFLTLALLLVFPAYGSLILKKALPARGLLISLILLPQGFLMGIPFPGGIRMLSGRWPYLIPWAWAFNGFFSVLMPVLSVMLAMKTGFSGVLLAGAVAYWTASLPALGFRTSPIMGTKITGVI